MNPSTCIRVIGGEWLESRVLLAADTPLRLDIYPGPAGSYPEEMVSVNETLFFTANNGRHGRELWKSDGTPAGTVRVADIFAGRGSSHPQHLTSVGDTVYFTADDGVRGRELWKSDGTVAGTVLVKDVTPGIDSVFDRMDEAQEPFGMVAMRGTLFFNLRGALWRSDGTDAGTVAVRVTGNVISSLTVLGDSLFFGSEEVGSIGDPHYSSTLWLSDGTTDGTRPVHNDLGNPRFFGSGLYEMRAVGNRVFFFAWDQGGVPRLYASDGTSAGTVALAQFATSGLARSFAAGFRLTADETGLFFTVGHQSDVHRQSVRELWRSDGTADGTRLLGSFEIAYDFESDGINDAQLTTAGGGVVYFRAGVANDQLWRSDGTVVGTVLATVMPVGAVASAGEGELYVGADDGVSGEEPWRSTSASGGLSPLGDIRSGGTESAPRSFTVAGENVFFNANDGVSSRELWVIRRAFARLAAHGTLTVKGTEAADNISLIVRGSTLRVWRDGETLTFPLADVKHIEIDAGDGDDAIDWTGIAIPTYCFGGLGNDRMTAGTGDDTLSGGGGRDYLSGGGGDDFVSGGATNDELYGGPGADHLEGGAANDLLAGGAHDDRLYGDAGNDVLSGNDGKDVMYGGDGDDSLTGGIGWDLHSGQAGNDRLFARDGRDDEVLGGDGDDEAEIDHPLDVLLGVENVP